MPGDTVLVGGSFSGTTYLHGQPLSARGDADGFVLKIDAGFDVHWAGLEAGNGTDAVTAVAWDESANSVLAAGDSTEGLWLGDDRLDIE